MKRIVIDRPPIVEDGFVSLTAFLHALFDVALVMVALLAVAGGALLVLVALFRLVNA